MEQGLAKSFFYLLASAVKNGSADLSGYGPLDESSIDKMSAVAKQHDVSVLLAYALDINGIPLSEKNKNALEKEKMLAVYRYQKQNYELMSVLRVLNERKIAHIPLKGSVIRKYYPKPWLRTSCDIDVLVRREELGSAKEALVSLLGYEAGGEGSHDVSLYSKSGVHIELHFDLNEPNFEIYPVLNSVWDSASPVSDGSYTYEMSRELFYFYHVAHIAKHFLHGGCGIRPLLDLEILDSVGCDGDKRDGLLRSEGLLIFCESLRELVGVWFARREDSELSLKIQNYIISGGVYGNLENKVKLQQAKHGGKFKYAMSKIFPSYEKLKCEYPIIAKHKILTPLMHIARWFRIVFRGGLRRSARELKINGRLSDSQAFETKQFLEEIGLK